ncbi:MAG: hypothetical protein KJ597_04615 [Nanoarchaeota archaeon]|nr:hypothetical protein [Nanoarchaeota archaeon]MBU1622829.1 hypothetical protein [Nanoarchaeota archaeon]
MENYTPEEEKEDKFTIEKDSPEEGFIQGYESEDEVEECAECGAAINPEKKVKKSFDGEDYQFCCESCAKEYAESMS